MMIFNFFIGACLGSHALVIYQRRKQMNFIFAYSRCDTCNYPLTLFDQLPLISYLFKKGKCTFCRTFIPIEAFLVELIGGLLFIHCDFSSAKGIISAVFFFFIFLVSIFDYYEQEFDIIYLLPCLYLLLVSPFALFHFYNIYTWLIFISVLTIFLIMNINHKLGWGDTLIFLLLGLYFGIFYTLHVLLFACLLAIISYFFSKNGKTLPFLPFLIGGMIIHNCI